MTYYLREEKDSGHYFVRLEDSQNIPMSVSSNVRHAKKFDRRNSIEEFRSDNREVVGHMEIVRDNTEVEKCIGNKNKVAVSERELEYAEMILDKSSFHSLLDDLEMNPTISNFISSFEEHADIGEILKILDV